MTDVSSELARVMFLPLTTEKLTVLSTLPQKAVRNRTALPDCTPVRWHLPPQSDGLSTTH